LPRLILLSYFSFYSPFNNVAFATLVAIRINDKRFILSAFVII